MANGDPAVPPRPKTPDVEGLVGGACFEELADEEVIERPDGTELPFVSLRQESPAKIKVLIVQGWNETYLRYLPLMEVLYAAGFSVYSYDHRCQGMASRYPGAHPQVTVVDSFSEYTEDLKTVVKRVNALEPGGELCAVAHSMGGLITCTVAADHPEIFSRIVLSAPMFSLKSVHPTWVVHAIATVLMSLGFGNKFAPDPTQHPIDASGPIIEKLTHDAPRLAELEDIWQRVPAARQGGVSVKWLKTCIEAQRRFARIWARVEAPTLLMHADEDEFVHTGQQVLFGRANGNVRRAFFPGTYHELFNEVPAVRAACETLTVKFIGGDSGEGGDGDETDGVLMPEAGECEEFDTGMPPFYLGPILHWVSPATGIAAGALIGYGAYLAVRRLRR